MPDVSAIVLAAGLSSRMAPQNKLLLDRGGMPLIRRAVLNLLAASPAETVVVTGHQADQVMKALAGLPVRLVHNPDYREGMGSSLACGARRVSPGAAAALVCLGDVPDISPPTIQRLIECWRSPNSPGICVPTFGGRQGHPVVFDRDFIPALAVLAGDTGAKALLQSHADRVQIVEVDDSGILLDVDTLPGA